MSNPRPAPTYDPFGLPSDDDDDDADDVVDGDFIEPPADVEDDGAKNEV